MEIGRLTNCGPRSATVLAPKSLIHVSISPCRTIGKVTLACCSDERGRGDLLPRAASSQHPHPFRCCMAVR